MNNRNLKRVKRSRSANRGFTLVELLVLIAIIGILIGMMLPAVRRVREPARRITCQNNVRQIALATLNFESAHLRLPAAMGDSDFVALSDADHVNRLSGFIALLPFMEGNDVYDQITKPLTIGGVKYLAMGPEPWTEEYEPWSSQRAALRCATADYKKTNLGQTNFAFCIGDLARDVHQPKSLRGMFGGQLSGKLADITDGTSCTIMFTEIGTASDHLLIANYATDQPISVLENPSELFDTVDSQNGDSYNPNVSLGWPRRGGCWADGGAGPALVNTILKPQSPSCLIDATVDDRQTVNGIFSAGGRHRDGINVAFADGSSRFISDSIDIGDPTKPTLKDDDLVDGSSSPYGVWGALGVINDGKVLGDDDF